MANFAKVNSNNIVERLVSVNNEELLDENEQESEALGIAFLHDLYGYDSDMKWVQTSYNANFRNRFACIGDTYDKVRDVFLPKKPESHPSWVFNDQTLNWEPPIPQPEEERFYFIWNDETESWDSFLIPESGPITQIFEWDEEKQLLIVKDKDAESIS